MTFTASREIELNGNYETKNTKSKINPLDGLSSRTETTEERVGEPEADG